jgi:hypothetical protein
MFLPLMMSAPPHRELHMHDFSGAPKRYAGALLFRFANRQRSQERARLFGLTRRSRHV